MQQIPFTKEQCELLLRLIYLGDWMANANKIPGKERSCFAELEQYIYSFAENFGLQDLIVKDEGIFYPSKKLEEDSEICECIEEYDVYAFWDNLCEALSKRDAIREHGEKKLASMDHYKRFEILTSLNDAYQKYFETHGLEKIHCAVK